MLSPLSRLPDATLGSNYNNYLSTVTAATSSGRGRGEPASYSSCSSPRQQSAYSQLKHKPNRWNDAAAGLQGTDSCNSNTIRKWIVCNISLVSGSFIDVLLKNISVSVFWRVCVNWKLEEIPPPKPDFTAPPPYEVATKLPSYEEVQREKTLQGEPIPQTHPQIHLVSSIVCVSDTNTCDKRTVDNVTFFSPSRVASGHRSSLWLF